MPFSHVDSKGCAFEDKLDRLFQGKSEGFFIELGAHDGITQSNTAKLEYDRMWKGLLVEPTLRLYEECCRNRPNSQCVRAACVASTFKQPKVMGDFGDGGGCMSSINGMRCHAKLSDLCAVPAVTLEHLLDQMKPSTIDFLSLDTEGYELNVLDGLNLDRYRPHYMLIEIYNTQHEQIVEFLTKQRYELLENFSNYNKTDNPGWDGTHNDYLFRDAMRSN